MSNNRPVLSSVAKRREKVVVGMTVRKKEFSGSTKEWECVSGETEGSTSLHINVYYVALLAFLTTAKNDNKQTQLRP